MMTHRRHEFEVLWLLILLILIVSELQATTLRDNSEQAGAKSGHGPSAAPNDYGPAIKITSSILQLSKSTEGSTTLGNLGLEHHETTLEQPWPVTTGYQLPAAQTVWLEFPANHQPDFHLIAVPDVSNHQDRFTPSLAGGNDVSGVSDEGRSTLSTGLHTQIISSGTGVTNVSDNLDFGDAVAEKVKGNRRTSYGR
ncbi:PREDICTED: uncharacterized protein LOC108971018 [Bactrocera latifrons]|uniref:uncharacterized protein LOC108971018 n=1 Tax=Bactrocera latifrons TaxID=174628 RepID=UPI0008DCE4DB|nr:PREDICTED: uncharacterized protein LOC108971018 [Bactrocera latifrons]